MPTNTVEKKIHACPASIRAIVAPVPSPVIANVFFKATENMVIVDNIKRKYQNQKIYILESKDRRVRNSK
jgi:hypothetical protein